MIVCLGRGIKLPPILNIPIIGCGPRKFNLNAYVDTFKKARTPSKQEKSNQIAYFQTKLARINGRNCAILRSERFER
jgi:hypothetical protein